MNVGSKALASPNVSLTRQADPPAAKSPAQPPPGVVLTKYEPPKTPPMDLGGGAGAQAKRGQSGTNPAGNVPQAWGNTCGPNALMAMEASASPERAAQFQGMSREQRAEYEVAIMNASGENGNAGFRPGADTAGGWGYTQMSREVSNRFGGLDPASGNGYAQDQQGAVDAMTAALNDGRPVAIGLSNHWLAATDIRETKDGGTEVLVQDSWTGTSVWVPTSEIAAGGNWVGDNFPGLSRDSTVIALVIPSSSTLDAHSTNRANEGAALQYVQQNEGSWTQRDLPAPAQTPSTTPGTPWRFTVP